MESQGEVQSRQGVSEGDAGVGHPPFFALEPALLENLAGTEGGPGGARMLHKSRTRSLNYLEGAYLSSQLLDMAGVKPTNPKPNQSRLLFADQSLFLASVEPVVLVLVPNHGVSISSPQVTPDTRGLSSFLLSTSRGNQSTALFQTEPGYPGSEVLLTSAFPDSIGIRVLSDQWAGIKSIEQLAQDAAIPFSIEPATDMPGYLRLVLKSKP